MIFLSPVIIALLNILANHTMLTNKRSNLYCVIAFIINTIVVTIMFIYFRRIIVNLTVYKYVFYMISAMYMGYIYMVFSDSFAVKLFSMFSIWGFSTMILSISISINSLIDYKMNLITLNTIRVILQVFLLIMSYKCYGLYFKRVLEKIHTSIIYLMSGYMFIALMLLINSFSWNNQTLNTSSSILDIALLVIFIVLGYSIMFFGINSASRNALLTQNITSLKEESDMYFNLANYDNLTGIASRQNVINQISKTINDSNNTNKKLMVFMFDVDKFKSINDRYGHLIGDEALKDVVTRVQSCLRGDDLIGRFGGDEFIIFLKGNNNKEDAKSLVRRITNILIPALIIGKESIQIDISIGISIFPVDAMHMDELFDQADQAMYKAKERIGTTYEFFNDL